MRAAPKLASVGVFLYGALALAQGPIVRPMAPLGPVTPAPGGLTQVGAATQSMIHGMAVDADTAPLPNATVQLRNLQTNQVEHVSTANQVGEFTFIAQPEVPYVVEIADRAGNIVAVGDVVTAQAGDVAGALVAIPTRLPAVAGVFGETAGSVASAAASTGISAVQARAGPFISPEK